MKVRPFLLVITSTRFKQSCSSTR